MQKIGLIGGIGAESTLYYYRAIIDAFRRGPDEPQYPEIVVYSANLTELLGLLGARDWPRLTAWLLAKITALHAAGAEFVAIGSNSPHIVFDDVRARSPLPLVSIVEETCRHAAGLGLKKLGLMGTQFTMESDFYQRAFRAGGMELVVPAAEDRGLIQKRLFAEIELGIIRDETRQELLGVVRRLVETERIEAVVLGCTELPLILSGSAYGVPLLDSTAIHVDAIVKRCLGG